MRWKVVTGLCSTSTAPEIAEDGGPHPIPAGVVTARRMVPVVLIAVSRRRGEV